MNKPFFSSARARTAVLPVLLTILPFTAGYSPAAFGTAPQFSDGDAVVFIGDSITHTGTFSAVIYDYYLTRFPARKIKFINAGIAGDSAYGAIGRVYWDVLSKGPTVANIMFGMNDVGQWLYDPAILVTPTLLAQRQTQLNNFIANLDILSSSLTAAGIKVNIVTESPYDQTAKIAAANYPGMNDALATVATMESDLAIQRGLGYVNIHTPMTALNTELQKSDPTFSLIGPDRTHPGDLGNLVMGFYFLKSQGVPAQVSTVGINALTGTATQQDKCLVTNIAANGNSLSFSVRSESLPFPATSAYRTADSLVPITKDLNNELLRVTGLPVGDYSLLIDGNNVGTFKDADLNVGINLATNQNSPSQIQAQGIHNLNWQRFSLETQLRDIALVEQQLHKGNVNLQDSAAIKAYLDAWIAGMNGASYQSYYQAEVSKYYSYKPREAAIKSAVDGLVATLYVNNQPISHNLTLSPATPASQNSHSGTYSLTLTASGAPTYKGPYQDVAGVVSSAVHVFKTFIKGSGQKIRLLVYDSNWVMLTSQQATAGADWVEVSTPPFNTGANKKLHVQIQDYGNVAGTAYIDDFFLGISGGNNILMNPGLESVGSSWTMMGPFAIAQFPSSVSANTHSGTWGMELISSGTPAYTGPYQEFTNVQTNKNYVFRTFIKGSGQKLRLVVYDRNWVVLALQEVTATSNWSQVGTASFNTGVNTTLRVQLQDYGNMKGISYIDDGFVGVDAGANVLQNSGFEAGMAFWNILGPFQIVQNP